MLLVEMAWCETCHGSVTTTGATTIQRVLTGASGVQGRPFPTVADTPQDKLC